MNKQELIEKYEKLEGVCKDPGAEIARLIFLEDLRELDEPQKPVVPQFVVDWYEENKDDFEGNLYRFTRKVPTYFDGAKLNDFERWFISNSTKTFQTLVNMHQFGYTVEKEKRYLVRVKGVNEYGCYLNKGSLSKEYFWESKTELGGCRTKHTRKQLEDDDFGWVFDCPGIEIEEVEE